MHQRARRFAALLSAVLLVGACQPTGSSPSSRPAPEPPSVRGTEQAEARQTVPGAFTFAAAGDIGANRTTAASLRALDGSPARFFVALGDMDYDETDSDRAFCRFVKNGLPAKGRRFPFELLVGNHEADGGPDGRIGRHADCLPDRLGSTGKYARQYAFTYPRRNPVAKLIMIAPRITSGGHRYRYGAGTADRKWLVRQIANARAAGIEWVIVGMHYPCLSVGSGHPECSSGHAVHNLLLRKRVDVILAGHNHVYERSKQLRLAPSCPKITSGAYDADCVADSGADGSYAKGAGTVQITSGRFGGRPMEVNEQDPDAPWFAVADAGTTGYTQFTVSRGRLEGRYVASTGSFSDSFVVVD